MTPQTIKRHYKVLSDYGLIETKTKAGINITIRGIEVLKKIKDVKTIGIMDTKNVPNQKKLDTKNVPIIPIEKTPSILSTIQEINKKFIPRLKVSNIINNAINRMNTIDIISNNCFTSIF